MPASLELQMLGLTEESLRGEAGEAELERRRAHFERRSIELDGQRVSADSADYPALVQAVRATLTDAFLRSPKTLATLTEIGGRPAGGGGRTGGAGRGARRPTEAEKLAIGFVGEFLAFEWLTRNYPNVVPENWRSTYRNHVFSGTSGDDSLGYDFEIFVGNRKLLFEVKTTTGDRLEIELGETAVATAQRHARGRQYRILFIANALDSARRSIHVLPNPFSDAGRGFYRLVGTGLKYQFVMRA